MVVLNVEDVTTEVTNVVDGIGSESSLNQVHFLYRELFHGIGTRLYIVLY